MDKYIDLCSDVEIHNYNTPLDYKGHKIYYHKFGLYDIVKNNVRIGMDDNLDRIKKVIANATTDWNDIMKMSIHDSEEPRKIVVVEENKE